MLQVKAILHSLEGLDAKLAAAAHSHAAKGKELQERLHNLVSSMQNGFELRGIKHNSALLRHVGGFRK
jgi:hypothetical protein